MKRFFLLLVLITLIVPLSTSCKKVNGKGDVLTQTRSITGFTGIGLALEAQLRFIPDSIFRVELTAQENVLDVVETFVEGGVLVVKLEHNIVLGKHEEIQVLIHAPGINLLDISGSGNIIQTGNWISPSIRTSISGSGNLNLGYLEAAVFSIYISGSGNIQLTAGKLLDATISGSGNILYDGNPVVYTHISGSGTVRHI
jgi:hypothetical protein